MKTCLRTRVFQSSHPPIFALDSARFASCLLAFALVSLGCVRDVRAQTWIPDGGGSWAGDTNWNPAIVPNAFGAMVIFPSPSAGRTVSINSEFVLSGISLDVTNFAGNTITVSGPGAR